MFTASLISVIVITCCDNHELALANRHRTDPPTPPPDCAAGSRCLPTMRTTSNVRRRSAPSTGWVSSNVLQQHYANANRHDAELHPAGGLRRLLAAHDFHSEWQRRVVRLLNKHNMHADFWVVSSSDQWQSSGGGSSRCSWGSEHSRWLHSS